MDFYRFKIEIGFPGVERGEWIEEEVSGLLPAEGFSNAVKVLENRYKDEIIKILYLQPLLTFDSVLELSDDLINTIDEYGE